MRIVIYARRLRFSTTHCSTHIQTVPTASAVLDLHFWPHDESILSIATSTGTLASYRIHKESSSEPVIAHVATLRIAPPSTLNLAFTFHSDRSSNLFASTLSTGEVVVGRNLITDDPSERDIEVAVVLNHDLEAWTAAFDWDGTGIFSGGDDSIFQFISGLNDLVQDSSSSVQSLSLESGPDPTRRDRRSHSAGVTAILPLSSDLVLTGSYDDYIRLIRTSPRPRVLVEENLGGGVWRLKVVRKLLDIASTSVEGLGTNSAFIILASCMHAGARIVRVESKEGEWSIDVLAKFEEHESMNYGSDIQPLKSDQVGNDEMARTVISTSFYDKRLCMWRWSGAEEQSNA